VGPTDNYAAVPGIGKWTLIVCMLLGRLEIYTILVLLVPGFWRK
jgi:trk system potassium uptake protein TrkH